MTRQRILRWEKECSNIFKENSFFTIVSLLCIDGDSLRDHNFRRSELPRFWFEIIINKRGIFFFIKWEKKWFFFIHFQFQFFFHSIQVALSKKSAKRGRTDLIIYWFYQLDFVFYTCALFSFWRFCSFIKASSEFLVIEKWKCWSLDVGCFLYLSSVRVF